MTRLFVMINIKKYINIVCHVQETIDEKRRTFNFMKFRFCWKKNNVKMQIKIE